MPLFRTPRQPSTTDTSTTDTSITSTSASGVSSADQAMKAADALVAQGRHLAAIDLLMAANASRRSPAIEERLVDLRHEGFFHVDHSSTISQWPPAATDLFSDVVGIPEITRDALSVDAVRAGVLHHGALIVRRLFDDEQVELLSKSIRRAVKAFDAHKAGAPAAETTPWYRPLTTLSTLPEMALSHRQWVRTGGGCLAADSPRAMYNLTSVVHSSGMGAIVEGYLGERPALSVLKTTLRTVAPQKTPNGWHQDGAFLGHGIRTLNLWVSLSHCGIDAPSIDLVPRRLDRIVPTGTAGAAFDWSVSDTLVAEAAGEHGIHHGVFAPGDVVLFDEMNLHRTSATEEMTQNRLAIEAWFFAPSHYPLAQYPLLF
jgi:hypothetical protein